MARRPSILPSKSPRTAAFNVFPELPGAVFYGDDVLDDDRDAAKQLQAIRDEYEQDGYAPILIQELTRFGFPDSEIAVALLNPATITNCGYLSALIAA